MNQELDDLIEKLISLGEDADELHLWKSMFPNIDREEQDKLLENLRDELKELTLAGSLVQ